MVFGCVAAAFAKPAMIAGSERKSGDDVARPMRKDHDARHRKANRKRLDRPAGSDRQGASRGRQSAHVQSVA